ncbi:MAG: acylphosphatase [Gammaproteobacteria bacterium]|nr:MAG: acylphosphatase [Gammaproteobacteria bacterium]
MNVDAFEVRVRGRVHGVCFRASTRRAAPELGLVGWVRDEADGSVAMHVHGPPGALEQFQAWTHRGPPGARVDTVEVASVAVESRLETFEVRR